MKVNESNNYNKDFPEQYPWGNVDSQKLSSLASYYTSAINHDLRNSTDNRHLVPGLRFALNAIAELADC